MTDFRARLQQAWTEDLGRSPTWVEEFLFDHYAERMDAAMARRFADVVDWEPLGLFGVDVAPWLADELDLQGVSPLRAALAAARPHDTPPAALRGPSSSVPPNGTPVEEERTLANRVRSARDAVRQADAPILAAAAAQLLGGFERWEPAGSDVEPAAMTEEQRVAHELVPLIRQAAAEVPPPDRVNVLGGHLREFRTVDAALDQHDGERQWGQFLDRWDLTADLTPRGTPGFLTPLDMRAAADAASQATRHHENGADCWCGAFMLGGTVVHLDDRVPRGGPGWVFNPDDYEGWFQP